MERKPKTRWLEPAKTLLIALLALLAVFLLTRTSIGGADSDGGLFSSLTALLPGVGPGSTGSAGEQGAFVRPVRLAVTNGKPGRYGLQYDQDAMDSRFGGILLNLFSDALAGAETPQSVSTLQWQSALSGGGQAGIYLDLLGAVPCADLPVWLGGRTTNPALPGSVRRLLLTADADGGAVLYYNNEEDGSYYACNTAEDLAPRLTAAVAGYEPNGAVFAFEAPERYPELAPETLILHDPPIPKVYTAANPIPAGSDAQQQMIQDLFFHTQTNAVRLDDLVVREGTDTLRLSPQGVVTYYSANAEDPRFPAGSGEKMTNNEMITAAWGVLDTCMADRMGAARLYLAGILEEEGDISVYFSYQLGGAPVQVGSDGYAAKLTFSDGRISAFTLQMRRYEDTGTTAIVLPEVQAAAAMAALNAEGSELLLCYFDQGGDRTSASWIAK